MKTFVSVVWQKHTKMTAVHVTASVPPLPPRPAPSVGLKWAEHAARKDYLCILGQQQRTHLVAGISPLPDVADDPKQRGCSEGCGRAEGSSARAGADAAPGGATGATSIPRTGSTAQLSFPSRHCERDHDKHLRQEDVNSELLDP